MAEKAYKHLQSDQIELSGYNSSILHPYQMNLITTAMVVVDFRLHIIITCTYMLDLLYKCNVLQNDKVVVVVVLVVMMKEMMAPSTIMKMIVKMMIKTVINTHKVGNV